MLLKNTQHSHVCFHLLKTCLFQSTGNKTYMYMYYLFIFLCILCNLLHIKFDVVALVYFHLLHIAFTVSFFSCVSRKMCIAEIHRILKCKLY